ncbi:hypothetical protein HZH66_001995 [Vespula vulgaris]|uniref:Uncharacterized protein n=1 Tax=Vespula vulgaris TaxID=7454 RepID=A0A834KIQ2_VESVU|nr:hypothetical protein HZH66_001995 [Vespula vulgaris]
MKPDTYPLQLKYREDEMSGKGCGRYAGRQASKQASKQAGRQTDRQTDRQSDRQTDRRIGNFGIDIDGQNNLATY